MSNKKTKTSLSKATNAAEDVNNDDSFENIIQSEFVVVSTDEIEPDQDELSTAVNEKKISSKAQNKKTGGPSSAVLNFIKQRQEDRKAAELEAFRKEQEIQRLQEERERQKQEELRVEEEHRERKKQKKKERIQRQTEEGSYLPKRQRKKLQRAQIQLEAAGIQIPSRNISQSITSHNSESSKKRILYDDYQKTNTTLSNTSVEVVMVSIEPENNVPVEEKDSSTDDWEQDSEEEKLYSEQLQTLKMIEDLNNVDNNNDHQESSESELTNNHHSSKVLRAPVICVLGHVDTGKTTILDNLRQTHVQDGEAGGITQQIGATNVPRETIYERTKMCREMITREGDLIIPGLLIIDTPGHETFNNLRSRGSSLCDLAILVVDIMHGIEPQTIESIQLLIEKQTPFIIALNKIDLLYDWKSNKEKNIEFVLQEQSLITKNHFENRCNDIIVQFAEQGLNVALYYKNSDPNEFYSMIPTSARSSDGMGSLIAMIIEMCQTTLAKRITKINELQATVLEVKTIDGLGTTIDVVLVNGSLSVEDTIVLAGKEGPIVTQIQGFRIPESNQELRVTNQFQIKNKVEGTCGIKILAKDLKKSMAGLPLFVAQNDNEIDYFKNEIEIILKTTLNSIKLKEKGVYVQASTLGSLEAFLKLLKTFNIPYAGINIGSVHRKDVIRASAQLEKDLEWATILAFDVKIEKDAQEYANALGIKIFQHDKIYGLCDMFVSYKEQIKKENQEKYRHLAIFPCKLKILPQFIFKSRDPIICGVFIQDGFIKLGTLICIPSRDFMELGRIVSIEKNHKSLDIARKGEEVCIKIESINGETTKMYGRHFDENDILISKISRESIDILKAYFREDMQKKDWELILELKKIFHIN